MKVETKVTKNPDVVITLSWEEAMHLRQILNHSHDIPRERYFQECFNYNEVEATSSSLHNELSEAVPF